MIKVIIKRDENIIKSIELSGHAKYDIYGKDIVCAGVSSMLTYMVNACLMFDSESIKYEEGKVFKLFNLKEDNTTNTLLENFYNLIKELSTDYKDNIKIEEE